MYQPRSILEPCWRVFLFLQTQFLAKKTFRQSLLSETTWRAVKQALFCLFSASEMFSNIIISSNISKSSSPSDLIRENSALLWGQEWWECNKGASWSLWTAPHSPWSCCSTRGQLQERDSSRKWLQWWGSRAEICQLWYLGRVFGRSKYGKVRRAWKDLAKCSSDALVLGQ